MFSARATSLRTTSYKSNCIEHINMAEVDEVEHEVPFRDGKPPLPVKVSYTRNVSNTPNVQGRSLVGVVLAHGAGGDMDSGHLPVVARHLVAAGAAAAVVRFTCKPPHLPTRVAAFKAVLQAASRVWPETRGIARWVCAGHSMGGRAAVEVAHEAWLQQDEGAAGKQRQQEQQKPKQHKGRAQQQLREQKQEEKEEKEASQKRGAKKRRRGEARAEEEGESGVVGVGAEGGGGLASKEGGQGGAVKGGKGGEEDAGGQCKQHGDRKEQQQDGEEEQEAKETTGEGVQNDGGEVAPQRRSTRAAATKAAAALRAGAVPTAAGGTNAEGRRSHQPRSGPAAAAAATAGSSDQSQEGGGAQGASGSTAGATGETAAAEGQLPRVVGVLLLSYPLHPPGNTADLRDTPLADLRLPVLFVRGTRDDFSTQPHFDALLDRMRGGGRGDQVQVHLVEGGDHGLAVRGAAAKQGRGAGAKKGGAGSETAGEAAGPLDLALGAVARWMKEL